MADRVKRFVIEGTSRQIEQARTWLVHNTAALEAAPGARAEEVRQRNAPAYALIEMLKVIGDGANLPVGAHPDNEPEPIPVKLMAELERDTIVSVWVEHEGKPLGLVSDHVARDNGAGKRVIPFLGLTYDGPWVEADSPLIESFGWSAAREAALDTREAAVTAREAALAGEPPKAKTTGKTEADPSNNHKDPPKP